MGIRVRFPSRAAVAATALTVLLAALLTGCNSSSSSDTAASTSAPAAPTDPGPYTLTLDGTGFDPHNGQLLSVALVKSGGSVVSSTALVVSNGTFSVTMADVLQAGTSYHVDYYADYDQDGVCDAAGDHIWSVSIPAPTADVSLTEPHGSVQDTTVCGSFPTHSMTFSGYDFTPHPGQTLFVSVFRQPDGQKVASGSAVIASDTAGSVSLAPFTNKLQEGLTYTVDLYADVNGNQKCDTAVDHIWQTKVTAGSSDVALSFDHNAAQNSAGCSGF